MLDGGKSGVWNPQPVQPSLNYRGTCCSCTTDNLLKGLFSNCDTSMDERWKKMKEDEFMLIEWKINEGVSHCSSSHGWVTVGQWKWWNANISQMWDNKIQCVKFIHSVSNQWEQLQRTTSLYLSKAWATDSCHFHVRIFTLCVWRLHVSSLWD